MISPKNQPHISFSIFWEWLLVRHSLAQNRLQVNPKPFQQVVMKFLLNWIFYLLTNCNWCLYPSVTQQRKGLLAWFLHCSMLLHPLRCTFCEFIEAHRFTNCIGGSTCVMLTRQKDYSIWIQQKRSWPLIKIGTNVDVVKKLRCAKFWFIPSTTLWIMITCLFLHLFPKVLISCCVINVETFCLFYWNVHYILFQMIHN